MKYLKKFNESIIDGDFLIKKLHYANDFMRNDSSIRKPVDMSESEEELIMDLFGDAMSKTDKLRTGNFYPSGGGICFTPDRGEFPVRYISSDQSGINNYFIKFEDDWWIVILSPFDETWLCDGVDGLNLLSKYLHSNVTGDEMLMILYE